MHAKGLGYSAINTARSAISSVLYSRSLKTDVGSHKLVCRFIKGLFVLKPSLPRYSHIWDPEKVLSYMSRFRCSRKLPLKLLSMKTVTLLALLTVQRIQTLHALRVCDVSFTDQFVQISINALLKTSSQKFHVEPFRFSRFDENRRLCIYRHLRLYIERTRFLRSGEPQLFISFRKPHRCVSKQTLSRWVKLILERAGIDVNQFSSHSTRAASASKVVQFVPLHKVLLAGGWSGESCFLKHYNLRPVCTSVQNALLQSSAVDQE